MRSAQTGCPEARAPSSRLTGDPDGEEGGGQRPVTSSTHHNQCPRAATLCSIGAGSTKKNEAEFFQHGDAQGLAGLDIRGPEWMVTGSGEEVGSGTGEESMVLGTCMVVQEAGATQGRSSQAAF